MASGPTQLALGSGLMRVGIVCPYALDEPGGVQQVCLDLARLLRENGDEAFVVAPGKSVYDDGPGRDDTTVPVGRPTAVKANRSVVPLSLAPGSWRRVKRALRGTDLIHVHEPMVPLVGWAALSMPGPKVVTFHADAPSWVGRAYRMAPWLSRAMRRSMVTTVSETAGKAIPPTWGEARIIPNGIDVASFRLPVGRVRHRVAFLGRDEPRKGLDALLASWPAVRDSQPDAELIVIGVDRVDEVPGVRFMGRVSGGEKHRLLASSSIFVAPNTGGESFGIVIAEAMAAGCAVVASDLDSFRAVLGTDGLLVPVGDVAALGAALSQLLDDESEVKRLSEAGRRSVGRFDWSVVVGEYRQAYEAAISNR